MPRIPRLSLPGIPQHVLLRGHNHMPCFFSTDDYELYLDYLQDALRKYEVQVHAFCLMPNHVHLLMTPSASNGVARVVQDLGRRYVRQINYQNDRCGTLWEGRYHSCLIEDSNYVLQAQRYIELNPVRSELVKKSDSYPWSSFHYNAKGNSNYFVTPHNHYLELGATPERRHYIYRQFMRSRESKEFLRLIRGATQSNRILGDELFTQEVETELALNLTKRKPGRPKKKLYT